MKKLIQQNANQSAILELELEDYLGYWGEGHCKVTSIDKDKDICQRFKLRQEFEKHPNPSRVINANILVDELPWETFDLLTIIGSTVNEMKNYDLALSKCLRLLKNNGSIMYFDFYRYNKPDMFLDFSKKQNLTIIEKTEFREFKNIEFYVFLGKK